MIVDIVETGTTLKENDLGVFADVAQSTARLIANKASYQFSACLLYTSYVVIGFFRKRPAQPAQVQREAHGGLRLAEAAHQVRI